MRLTGIRITMKIYCDIVTDEMPVASAKVAGRALNGKRNARERANSLKNGGSEWESNPPVTGLPAARRF
jgi:hypothetical protein